MQFLCWILGAAILGMGICQKAMTLEEKVKNLQVGL